MNGKCGRLVCTRIGRNHAQKCTFAVDKMRSDKLKNVGKDKAVTPHRYIQRINVLTLLILEKINCVIMHKTANIITIFFLLVGIEPLLERASASNQQEKQFLNVYESIEYYFCTG